MAYTGFRTYSRTAVVILFFVIVFFLVIYLANNISFALKAEESYQAHRLVFDLLEEHLKNNNGRWPRSWEELKILTRDDFGGYTWPRDIIKVQKYVCVEFNIDIDKLYQASPSTFSGIKSVKMYYCYEREISNLLETAKTFCPCPTNDQPAEIDGQNDQTGQKMNEENQHVPLDTSKGS